MTEHELPERYREARQALLDVLLWGAENLIEHNHVRAAACVMCLDHPKMDVEAIIKLNPKNASIRFDVEDGNGERTTVLEIPISLPAKA